jgi:RNA polymerase sigma-70 factor (sigma-E family)
MIDAEMRSSEASQGRIAGLYRRHLVGALRLAYLVTGDRALAEDLVQEAFLRVFGRFTDLRDPGAFEAYLHRTVVNMARKHFRRGKVERRYVAGLKAARPTQSVEPDLTIRASLRDALLRLPDRQRAAIVLRYYADMSEAQASELLRCRPGTVKSLVSRGLESLRSVIDHEDELT